jgi:ankyrin repeat protein
VKSLAIPALCLLAVLISNAAHAEALPPLITAVKAGDMKTARQLLGNPNVASADGTTALHWAVNAANADAVELLLEAGANPDASNRYGVTPLFNAVTSGNAAIVEALLAAGANVNQALLEGETVLMTASRAGNAPIVKALLAHGADPAARENFHGETALIWAAAENQAAVVTALLEAGAGVDTRSTPTQFARRSAGLSLLPQGSWTPLMYAARDGAFDAATVLVKHQADLNLADPDGTTALVFAIINYHYDLAAMLLEHGADPDIADASGMNALFAAVDMKSLPWTFGRPQLTPAPQMDVSELIKLMLAKGADPNARLLKALMQRAHTDGDPAVGAGATAYMRAAKAGDLETMRLLTERGADPNLLMENGNTALMLAAGLGWRDGNMAVPTKDPGTEEEAIAAIQYCLDHGADINAAGDKGNTALHMATTGRGSLRIVQFLLDHGASPYNRNEAGQTPLDAALASRRDRSEVAMLLRAAMDDSQ